MAGGLGEIHHVLCVNSSSKYPQSEMGACLTRSDYKESHSTMKGREPSRWLVAPLLLLNPDWGDFAISLYLLVFYFTFFIFFIFQNHGRKYETT
jgi:hypothetical protein